MDYASKKMNKKMVRYILAKMMGVEPTGNGFKAGVADKAIEWFASSPEHWGSDDLNNWACRNFGISIKKV